MSKFVIKDNHSVKLRFTEGQMAQWLKDYISVIFYLVILCLFNDTSRGADYVTLNNSI
jgi:hypothetical protein